MAEGNYKKKISIVNT